MTESSSEITNSMNQAVGTVRATELFYDFTFTRELPDAFTALDALSRNFFWSWHPEGVEIFRELDPALWIKVEQNPRLMLRDVSDLRLWQCATDEDYVRKVNEFSERSQQYLSEPPMQAGGGSDGAIAYFCAEYGIHNSL